MSKAAAGPMTASQILALAQDAGIKGAFIKAFRNGQELRAYDIPGRGVEKIRALPAEHAA